MTIAIRKSDRKNAGYASHDNLSHAGVTTYRTNLSSAVIPTLSFDCIQLGTIFDSE